MKIDRDNKPLKLNLAKEIAKSVVNGPGTRYVIWTQGCPFHCPGCFNKDFQPLVEKNIVEVDSIATRILSVKEIEGVTFSGGEPTLQSQPLFQLSRILKDNGLTVMCYSGYTLKQLLQKDDPFVSKLIGILDILIDGPFIREKKQNLLWRGSSNQRVHFLSDIYSRYEPVVQNNVSEMEILVGRDDFILTGMLQEKIIKRMNQVMNEVNCG
jgi:anaerobic ribonucleoside-triphosphate reductase activating protein